MTVIFNETIGIRSINDCYVTDYFLEQLNEGDDTVTDEEILFKLARWIDTTPAKISNTLRPWFCATQEARLLGLPDGIPLFYQRNIIRELEGRVCMFMEIVSTGNVYTTDIITNPQIND